MYDAEFDDGAGILACNVYAYCANNPIIYKDDSGESITLTTILIVAGVGAIAGAVGQVASDLITSSLNGKWTFSNWQTYTGAVIGGTFGGLTLALTGNVSAANFVTGTVTTGVGLSLEKLTIKNYDKSWGEIAANTTFDGIISYGLGKLPGIDRLTSGRNSWLAVYKSGLTKIRNNNACRMGIKTISKGVGASIIGGYGLDIYYGIKQKKYDSFHDWAVAKLTRCYY